MSEAANREIPSKVLSRRIIQRLLNKGLISKADAAKLESKLAEGQIQASDWKLAFEKSLGLHKKR